MNKIIVVGHPQSGLEKVEELLLACGMAQALPSRREGFTPAQISETLVKVHGAVPVQQVGLADELPQITVAPVWQGLALDLMLANMEQSLWGWADVQAVYLLDYWKTQDPQTMFVLVYDTPQSALTRHAVEQLETDPEALQAKINGWMAYNAALLRFHLRNTERSLLVHSDQVQASAPHYLQQLSTRIDAPLQLPGDVPQNQQAPAIGAPLPVEKAEEAALTIHDKTQVVSQPDLYGNALAQWLAQQLLEEHPEAGELYAQLQAAASMPLRAKQGQALLTANGLAQQRYQAWTAFVAQQAAMQESVLRLAQLDKNLNDRQQQLQQSHSQIEQLHQASLAAQQRAQEQQRLLNSSTTALQNTEQENALLLGQLHKVQEELENHYLQAQEQAEKLAELPKIEANLKTAQEKANKLQQAEATAHKLKADLQAAQETIKKIQQTEAQLKKSLEQVSAKADSAELQEENELLLTQLHMVQEELERYYLENQQLKVNGGTTTPTSKAYYGAADRVKQQLSYRLGATMITQSRSFSGWLGMPFALHAEVKRFKKDFAARKQQNLPPIQKYRDAYEAERVKRHLSYRLGARMIANSKTVGGWVSMPWALLGEAKAFRKERQ